MPKGVRKTKASAKSAKKTAKKTPARVRKLTPKQKKQKLKEIAKKQPVIGSFRLTWQSFLVLRQFWRPLGGIILVYLIVNIIFASGLSAISNATSNYRTAIRGSGANRFADAFHDLGALFSSSGSYNQAANSLLQTFMIIIGSLVIIWALRHLLAGKEVGVKEAYYHAAGPLVPFIIVILVILFQLLPLTIGSSALGILSASAFGNDFVSFVFLAAFALLACWSLYLVCSSIFALYIVTLPDMQPLQALRSAKKLVRYRRLAVARRILFLPLVVLTAVAVVMYPIILFASFAAPAVFYVLGVLAILFFHTYLYGLYRSLLG